MGRAHFEHRAAVTASSVGEALERLRRAAVGDLAEQYVKGEPIDWAAVYRDAPARRFVELPLYPFQRDRYWVLDSDGPAPIRRLAPAKPRPKPPRSLQGMPVGRRERALIEALSAQVAATLGLAAPPDPRRPLMDLGIDSLMASELQTWMRAATGDGAVLTLLLSGASVEEMAGALEGVPAAAAEQEPARNEVLRYPLSHGQRALWFIHASAPESSAYNVGIALRIPSRWMWLRYALACKVCSTGTPPCRRAVLWRWGTRARHPAGRHGGL